MFIRRCVGAACVLAACSTVWGQSYFSSANLSGSPSGTATGPNGPVTFTPNSFNNYSATGGNGGTSGGLGDEAGTVATSSATITMAVTQSRGGFMGTTFQFDMSANAIWFGSGYSGSISSSANVLFEIEVTAGAPVEFALTPMNAYAPGWPGGSSFYSFTPFGGGAQIDGNLLHPGRYALTLDAFAVFSSNGSPGGSGRIGSITLEIVPGPGTGAALAAAGFLAARRRRALPR